MRAGIDRLARAARLRVRVATVTAVAAAGIAGCGGGRASTSAPPTRRTTPTASTTTPIAAPRPTLGGRHQLGVELEHELKLAGSRSGAYVYDLTTGTPVFSLRASTKRPPASVEKLFTSIVSLDELGRSARLHTAVYGAGRPGAGGVWHGDLYLRGGGDPTFGSATFNRLYEQGYGPTVSQLVAQLVGDGIRSVTGQVIGDASLFDSRPGVPSSGFAPDIADIGGELAGLTYDHGGSSGLTPGAFAARALARALRADHISALAAPYAGVTPPRARRLAIVSSPPLSVLLRLMNVPSDDFFAEMLLKQLGARFGTGGSTASGAHVVSSVLGADYEVHPTVTDGSGLSRTNRASPIEVVALLRAVWRTSAGNALLSSLPAVGVDGTVRTIAIGTPAQGRCFAKTGTLDNVTNLAGYCHAAGHQLVAFALFIDGPANWQAIPLIGKMVASIARRNPAHP